MTDSRPPADLRRLGVLLMLLSAVATLALAGSAVAQTPAELRAMEADGVREIVVRRAGGLDAAERRAVRRAVDATLVAGPGLPGVEVLRVPAGELDAAVAELRAHPDVRWAEPNGRVRATADSNYYLWAHANDGRVVGTMAGVADADADFTSAWSASTGAGVTVAVVDTGVHATHPDLAGRLAGNPWETGDGRETNGIDDDGNGLIDDARGWDWVAHDADPDDENGHGTHVAGTVAAVRGNGIGVAGGAPDAQVLALRVLDATGAGWDADVAAAFDYAGRLGVPVVNASLGGLGASRVQQEAIRRHPDTLFVVAAGNEGQTIDGSDHAPCTIPEPNVICVGASDPRDEVAAFSNRGAAEIDLFAPGYRIISTADGGGYVSMSGTSMATPQVAAAGAVVRAAKPDARVADLRQALLGGVDPVPALSGVSVTGGRLSALRALTLALDPPPASGDQAPVAPSPTPTPTPEVAPAPETPTPTPVAPPVVTPPLPPLAHATAIVRQRRVTARVDLRQRARVRFVLRPTGATAAQARRRRAASAKVVSRVLRQGISRVTLARLARGTYKLTVSVGPDAVTKRITVR